MDVRHENSTIRIFASREGAVAVGLGFLIANNRAVTCAHVINLALSRPNASIEPPTDGEIKLDFPFLKPNQTTTGHIVFWNSERDIAVLEISDVIPEGVKVSKLILDQVLWDQDVVTFGFPNGYPDGVWASGKTRGRTTNGWYEINDPQQTGFFIQGGFSGGAVWSNKLSGIIGMVVAADKSTQTRTAYMIPLEIIISLIPSLVDASNVQKTDEPIPTDTSKISSKDSKEVPAEISSDENANSGEPIDSGQIIRPIIIDDNALDKHAATDKPIQNIKQDKLDFKIYVNALHSFIMSKDTTTPITISVDGPWGTGKSSLMSMLKGKLDPQRDGVRKLYEWFAGLRPWWRWYFGFLKSSIAKWFGKTVISLIVRNDVDEDGIYLYFGQNNKRFHKYISDIAKGFSIDPEVLIQIANDEKKKNAESEASNQTSNDGKKKSTEPEVPNQTGTDEKKKSTDAMDKSVLWWAQVHANCEPMEPPYHYAVWLNAWKFDNQEEVWASLALATMEQIKQKHGLHWRMRFWLELTFSRFSFLSGLWQVVKQFLLPLIFAVVLASYNTIIESVTVPLEAFTQYGSPLLWAGFVISGLLAVSSIFKDPFQIPLDKVFDRPNYKDKVKFLSHFEKDFARIVRAATKNGLGWKPSKLVIFIDDLDRCEPPKSADIVEAVNLFLDAEGCVFVIGMDSESVAKSVEVKYKDLFERMKAENTGVVSLGRSFLDKIVQIPFSVPRATQNQISQMVQDMIGVNLAPVPPVVVLPNNSSSSPSIDSSDTQLLKTNTGEVVGAIVYTDFIASPKNDPASYAKLEVRTAILKGTELLTDNPRQVKTFINLFRLSIYIANERKILEEKIVAEKTSGLNLEKLAIWTACSVRWTGLVRHLYSETQTDSLCKFIHNVSEELTTEFGWKTGNKNIPTEFKKKLDALRKSEKGSEAHWCHLPWDWWLLEPDFLKVVKLMENIWALSSGELEVLLKMSRPLSPTTSTEAK